MAIKTKKGKYICFYCRKGFSTAVEADSCRDSHDLIYIPISRSDANKLLNYIYIPDVKILEGTNFIEHLRQALRKRHRDEKKTI